MNFSTKTTTQPKTAKEEKLEARLAEAQMILLAQDKEIRTLKKINLELETKLEFLTKKLRKLEYEQSR
jgi:hypothetical protein